MWIIEDNRGSKRILLEYLTQLNIEIRSLYLYHRSVTALFRGGRIFFGNGIQAQARKIPSGIDYENIFCEFWKFYTYTFVHRKRNNSGRFSWSLENRLLLRKKCISIKICLVRGVSSKSSVLKFEHLCIKKNLLCNG